MVHSTVAGEVGARGCGLVPSLIIEEDPALPVVELDTENGICEGEYRNWLFLPFHRELI